MNSIIFKNRFHENDAYHIEIKKYVSNICQQRTKKDIKRKKNLGGKSPVEWPYSISMVAIFEKIAVLIRVKKVWEFNIYFVFM